MAKRKFKNTDKKVIKIDKSLKETTAQNLANKITEIMIVTLTHKKKKHENFIKQIIKFGNSYC